MLWVIVAGLTYEIHWPHSNLGACGTEWQYQTHFMDGARPALRCARVFEPESTARAPRPASLDAAVSMRERRRPSTYSRDIAEI